MMTASAGFTFRGLLSLTDWDKCAYPSLRWPSRLLLAALFRDLRVPRFRRAAVAWIMLAPSRGFLEMSALA